MSSAFIILPILLMGVCSVRQAGPSQSRVKASLLDVLDSPAGAESGQPFLQKTPEGSVLLSWIERTTSTRHALKFAILRSSVLSLPERKDKEGIRTGRASWSQVQTVVEGNDFFVNWADVPSVVHVGEQTFAAHWLAKSGEGRFAYDVRLKLSTDGGRTWSQQITPHRDGTKTEHGFVSLFPHQAHPVGAVWLDGREMQVSEGEGHDGHADSGNMTLRAAAISMHGEVMEEVLLDERVCECCPTSAAVTDREVVVAYRGRSAEEVRDIFIVRYRDGVWSKPVRVHEDGWQIPGCPVNGPALAARGRHVAVAWYTGADGGARVNVAHSRDGGATFGPPVRVDRGIPLGRVDVELLPDRSALVSWLEWRDGEAELTLRLVREDGTVGRHLGVVSMSDDRSSGYPRMVLAGPEVYVAWTNVGKDRRVRIGRLLLDRLHQELH